MFPQRLYEMGMNYPFFNDDTEKSWTFNRITEDKVKNYKTKFMVKDLSPHILWDICIDQHENQLPSRKQCSHEQIWER